MSETTQTQLPAWAKEAGWTAADLADGWYVDVGGDITHDILAEMDNCPSITLCSRGRVWLYDDTGNTYLMHIVPATSLAAARQCALDIVNAIKRARGSDVPTL